MCPMILGEEGGLVNVSDYLLVLAHLGCSGLLLIYFVIAQALYYAFVLNYYRSWTRR